MKKLLILSVPSGGGHVQAAQALLEAGQALYPNLDIKYINALDYSSRAARLAYQKAYLTLVKLSPNLWGFLFNKSDSLAAKKILNLTRKIQTINAKPLIDFIQEWQPQAIVSTHFFDNFVLYNQFKTGQLSCPWYTVITDFYAHSLWLNEFCTQYFVAAPEVREQLVSLDVPANKITVSGIPLRQQFLKKFDAREIHKKYNLNPNLPVILALAGGFGLGDLDKIVKTLADLPTPAQIIAVVGDNKNLEKKLTALSLALSSRARSRDPYHSKIIVLGFIKNVAELMAIATMAVTKAGGVTVSECLALGLPIIVASSIPGQEEANCHYLAKHGVALIVNNLDELNQEVQNLLNDKTKLGSLAAAAKKIARPNAAADILNFIVRAD